MTRRELPDAAAQADAAERWRRLPNRVASEQLTTGRAEPPPPLPARDANWEAAARGGVPGGSR